MLLAISIAIFLVALGAFYVYFKYVVYNFWRKKGVFYVEPVVPIGNLTPTLMGKMSIGELFQDAYLKHKDHRVFGMYSFFKPNLIVCDPDLIRIILTKEFSSFHDRGMFSNEKIDPLSGHLILLSGKKWRNLRAKLTPTFTSGKIKQIFIILKEIAEEFTKNLENSARAGDSIDIKDTFSRFTTDVIMSTAFGIKSNSMKEPNNEVLWWEKKVLETSAFWNIMLLFGPQILDFFSISIIDKGATKFFIKLFRDNVEYRQANKTTRHDFMNLLIHLMEKGYVDPERNELESTESGEVPVNTSKLTMLEAAAQAFVFIMAGYETSATTATYCLYELTLHPELQEKTRKEIDDVLKRHGELTYEALNEMTYLHKVVQEALRKYPVVPVLNRVCTKDIDLPTTNIHIPKGTMVTIPVLGIHHDPAIYPDPDKYDPDRFNAGKIAARHPYAYLPFGEGPRACIGMKFGYTQTKVGILNLLSRYKFKLHPRTPVPLVFEKSSIILTVKGGVHLIIEPR